MVAIQRQHIVITIQTSVTELLGVSTFMCYCLYFVFKDVDGFSSGNYSNLI